MPPHDAHHHPLGPPERVVMLRERDFLAVPARAGLACVLDASGNVITLATTANLRAWARDRLSPDIAGPRAALAPIAETLRWATVGSALEADWLYLELGRTLIPRTYRAAADRWQAWYLRLDADADPPTWRKGRIEEFADAASAASAAPGTLIGPFRDKDAAGRFGELLDDAFELCRYPKELAQAPNGTACAYKQMGRCPAACDGSEPMHAYRARVRDAIHFAKDRAAYTAQLDDTMRCAAAEHDFEAAAAAKQARERTAKAEHRAFAHVTTLDRGRWLLIAPSERVGVARLTLAAAGTIAPIADVPVDNDDAATQVARQLAEHARNMPLPAALDGSACERIGLVAHTLYHRPARARGGFIALHEPLDPAQIRALVRNAAKSPPEEQAADASSDFTDREAAP